MVEGCKSYNYVMKLKLNGFRVGLDLILVSRTQSKLESVKEEIQQTYGDRSVEIFAIDLTTLDDASLERLEERVHELDVGILVNNAGMSFDHPDFVEVFDAKVHRDLLSINTITPTLVRLSLIRYTKHL